MNWINLLVTLAPLLFEGCQEKDNKARAKRIKRGGALVRMRIRRGLRQEGLRGKALRRGIRETEADIEAASESEVVQVLDEAMGMGAQL